MFDNRRSLRGGLPGRRGALQGAKVFASPAVDITMTVKNPYSTPHASPTKSAAPTLRGPTTAAGRTTRTAEEHAVNAEHAADRTQNRVMISGYLADPPRSGITEAGSSACSFLLAIGGVDGRETRVRVNAYDCLAEQCSRWLRGNAFLVVEGELMSRAGRFGRLVEVRALAVRAVVDDSPDARVDDQTHQAGSEPG